ncbi:hypothetical protein [Halorubrum sp. Eb13]|uniref:hypothetical protein n=1 Tax=Halorubrum sp. Eb13 TaxID=1383843 RepID=UPI0020CDB726|nr:hypothetical protein [Halorubrum sp. Eb13]
MKHHLKRAKRVYDERGLTDLIRATVEYAPIEVNNAIFRLQHGEGTRVMEEDWDTLILLDACRYDMFSERVPIEGELSFRISLGSTSEEFLRQNFEDSQYHDTVYVNANVYFPKVGLDQDRTFHSVIDLLDEWDENLEIAHPETVTEAAKKAHEQFPNKRVIVHYMQPHIPFIGERGRTITEEADNRNAWVPFRDGNRPTSIDELWTGYNENLDLVFEYVKELLNEIYGKVVISADHGNMVGERQGPLPTKRMFGHPWGVYSEELVKVPWFVINGKRRTIRSEPPTGDHSTDTHSEDLVEQRLRTLGYKE